MRRRLHRSNRNTSARGGGADARLRVLSRETNGGIEASIGALYQAATKDFVFLNSADGQWSMDAVCTMAPAIERGADLVVGVRPNKRDVYTPFRRVVSYCYEAIVRGLGAPVGDPGSIKLGRRALFAVDVASRGVFADGERLIRAARAGYVVVGVEVPFTKRSAGKATGARTDVIASATIDALRVALIIDAWLATSTPSSARHI